MFTTHCTSDKCFLLEVRGAHLGVTWLWLEAGVSTSTSPSAGGVARAVASPALLNRLLVGISGTDTADPHCIRSCSLAVQACRYGPLNPVYTIQPVVIPPLFVQPVVTGLYRGTVYIAPWLLRYDTMRHDKLYFRASNSWRVASLIFRTGLKNTEKVMKRTKNIKTSCSDEMVRSRSQRRPWESLWWGRFVTERF